MKTSYCALQRSLVAALLIFVTSFVGTAQFKDLTWTPTYTYDIHAGYGTTTSTNGLKLYCGRAYLGTNQGITLNKYAELGVGADVIMFTHYYKGDGLRFSAYPYFYLRPKYPINDRFSVFLDCSLGAIIPVVNQDNVNTDFMCHFGPGVRYHDLSLSCGLSSDCAKGNTINTFFVKIGLYLK